MTRATSLATDMLQRFEDEALGAFFMSASDVQLPMALRPKALGTDSIFCANWGPFEKPAAKQANAERF